MLLEIQLPVNRSALEAQASDVDKALVEANAALAGEAKKHFGAGKIQVGRLPDGRFYFQHIALGKMVRVPDDLAEGAVTALIPTLLPALRIIPPPGAEAVPGVHGIWARLAWVDSFVSMMNDAEIERALAAPKIRPRIEAANA